MSIVTHHRVAGMTCGHCASAVELELSGIEGVTGVQVTLATGDVSIASDRPLSDARVAAAVNEAGYELAP